MPSDPLIEADILIGGVRLTTGQALTVRVALEHFRGHIGKPYSLGKDPNGVVMRQNYLDRGREVLTAIHASIDEREKNR